MDSQEKSSEEFPVARVADASDAKLFGLQSKMWLLTLACVGVAVYIAWQSRTPPGIEITIEFPEGHGLKAGDTVRHHGIKIGHVTSVQLTADLKQVRTTVMLDRTAEAVARAKTRFWIVRPQLSLTNISGLETAVGSKYVAVDPGPADGESMRHFRGEREQPPLPWEDFGLEITLAAVESHGLSPGAPVTYRGIPVGKIRSVKLSDNAMNVVVKARVMDAYAHLVRKGSRFWKATGVDLDFGIKGFHLNTDSLAAITRGGVSFITPTSRDENSLDRVESGHTFTLSEELDEKWIRDAAELSSKVEAEAPDSSEDAND